MINFKELTNCRAFSVEWYGYYEIVSDKRVHLRATDHSKLPKKKEQRIERKKRLAAVVRKQN